MAEITARTSVPSDQRVESTQLNRVWVALNEQELFDRTQVTWLMQQAVRWGYEARVDEENAGWSDAELVFNAGETIRDIDRKRLRESIDAAARLPRPGDYRVHPAPAADAQVAA